jgi:4a-hydroxytetrahydrobiopterin dehydratase
MTAARLSEPSGSPIGEALSFVQRVGDLAESERHHPDIAFGSGRATVSLQTKKIKGLHKNDFIMAAKIDRIAVQLARARKQCAGDG